MGTYAIRMPDIGEGIAEVELVAWHVQPGDAVKEDQVVADVMTDKATVEIPSPVSGQVLSLGGTPGQVMAVGSELIRLEVEGAGNVKEGAASASGEKSAAGEAPATAVPPAGRATSAAAVKQSAAAAAIITPAAVERSSPLRTAGAPLGTAGAAPGPVAGKDRGATASPLPPPLGEGRGGGAPAHAASSLRTAPPALSTSALPSPADKPLASPSVRHHARQLGIDLASVRGSGPGGRITHEDLESHVAESSRLVTAGLATARPTLAPREGEEALPLTALRRRIAQKMQESKRRIPHFSYVEEIDVTSLEEVRAQLNERFAARRGKLTLLPFIARAIVLALDDFPQMNARFDDEAGVVTRYRAVHLGIATQTDAGLAVPVLHHAEAQDLWGLAAAIAQLAERTRNNKATRDDLTGSTITLTSLGPLGGIASTPVINHPEVAIVGVNRIVERPMFRGGAVVARQLMNLSSSFDHRVIDGMDAARFIQAVRGLLEQPVLLVAQGA
ncbi:2-oxo acid dehydrogenase subunit E2 [Ramlibacter ginsenosidimutans]|uniref:Dihydrolipoamide acetyltransferase component of pyruvate dehydrogenase complex n=1 Tax=Ramlibacter ginsenosidimutans TaxID=502333 RepID=A0A934TU22_9BURK|nr:dihydrolipoamide acetyltransferase family protein [Ramlibacter ginsenosidimutans]MBK6006895.1 2-oxo acid dehydrogenase subunit E2 [Ramlibacter ginsenosidimutans]